MPRCSITLRSSMANIHLPCLSRDLLGELVHGLIRGLSRPRQAPVHARRPFGWETPTRFPHPAENGMRLTGLDSLCRRHTEAAAGETLLPRLGLLLGLRDDAQLIMAVQFG